MTIFMRFLQSIFRLYSVPALSSVVNCQVSDFVSDDSGSSAKVTCRSGKVAVAAFESINNYITLKQTRPFFK